MDTLYQMAAKQGMSCYAYILEIGKGVPQNIREAIQLYKLAANKRHPKLMGCSGFLQITGNSVKCDVERDLSLIQIQIPANDPKRYLYLGRIADEELTERVDPQEAFAQYKRATDSGIPQGRLKVAGMLVAGRGTENRDKMGI
jgi:TPR repeat protein